MNPITLLVQVPVDVAVRAGVARAGVGAITLTDAHLGSLTEAELFIDRDRMGVA